MKKIISFHECAMILLISRVRSTKINADEWKLRVNFEAAVELLYNSRDIVELLIRDKSGIRH